MKWVCTIIQKHGRYRAIMEIGGKTVENLPENVDYITLKNATVTQTGNVILKRKDMIFERLSDFEKIATIDATQERSDCRVTIAERKAGWQPCWD